MQIRTQLSLTGPGGGDTRCAALFASALQPSDAPVAGMIAAAITSAVQRLGPRGCVGRVAQEFGDHPDAAARRMRWVRQLAAQDSPARPRDGQPGRAAARRSGPEAALPALPRRQSTARGWTDPSL